jgi:hypothetical protein
MTGKERKLARTNGRRLVSTIRRVEQDVQDFMPTRRVPRGGGVAVPLYCQPTATVPAATGSLASITPGKLTGQQVYMPSFDGTNYALTALPSSTSTLLNYTATPFAASKTATVQPSGIADTYCVVVQDC